MSIGAFAAAAGLTTSALRFYDDAGVFRPDRVDPVNGYRLYSATRVPQASQLRRLREIGMPLAPLSRYSAATPVEAVRLIDEHVATLTSDALAARRTASALRSELGASPATDVPAVRCRIPGPVLAAAIDQVLTSTVDDPALPVLGGIRWEISPDALSLISTDRYRLTIRTVVPEQPADGEWTGVLSGDGLRSESTRIRHSPFVTLEADETHVRILTADGAGILCDLLHDEFPDHQLMLDALRPVTHHVVLDTRQLLSTLEPHASDRFGLHISGGRPYLLVSGGTRADEARPDKPRTDDPRPVGNRSDETWELAGSASGPDLTVWFELTTLYPALRLTLGPDLMLDIRGKDQPATVRSADSGDLTSLAIPCAEPR